MPELPEVETMRRGIAAVQGGTVSGLRKIASRLRPIAIEPDVSTLRRRIIGRRIHSVERIGKRVLWRFDHGDALIFEPRMTGLLLVNEPPSSKHVRLRLTIEDSPIREVLFWDQRGLGRVSILSAHDASTRFGPDRIGPDAVRITCAQLRRRLEDSHRPIKVALLDQKVLAGVGNLYASEILHHAKVHPATECRYVTPHQWQAISRSVRSILIRAIEYEGSTLRDGTYRNSLNRNGTYQTQHRVYMKFGQTCCTCQSASIVRIVQAQRSTFYCPACQPCAR